MYWIDKRTYWDRYWDLSIKKIQTVRGISVIIIKTVMNQC